MNMEAKWANEDQIPKNLYQTQYWIRCRSFLKPNLIFDVGLMAETLYLKKSISVVFISL